MLSLFGLLCLLLAGLDAVLGLFDLSLLATRWSPALLAGLGFLLLSLESGPRGDQHLEP